MPEPMTTATSSAEPSATAVYALGRDPAESARLQRQSGELRSASAALLGRAGLRPGQAAIDLGCGPSGIIELLAERVSPGGRVVGLDADPAHVAMARELARQRGLGHVEILYREAGLEDIGVEARAGVCRAADSRRTVRADLVRSVRPMIVEGGWPVSGSLMSWTGQSASISMAHAPS